MMGGGATEPRSATSPVTGCPPRGRLYAGTARRDGAAWSLEDPPLDDAVAFPPLRGELDAPDPLSPRGVARPPVLLPLAVRERDP
jgi:hypothetical protein